MPALAERSKMYRSPTPPAPSAAGIESQAETVADLDRAAECEALAVAEPHRAAHWTAEAAANRARVCKRFDPLCWRLARDFSQSRAGRVVEYDDFLQEARLALHRATARYDRHRLGPSGEPTFFHTVAHIYITNALRRLAAIAYKHGFAAVPRKDFVPVVNMDVGWELVACDGPPVERSPWDEAFWSRQFERAHLSAKEVAAVRLRFVRDMTLGQMGDELGVSKERCRQLIVSATKKLAEVVG